MHNLIPTGRQCSAQAVRGDAAARRLAPISGAKTSTSLIEKMGDADTRNDHLSDADLPSQSALASLAEQPGDDAAKPRLPSRQAPERKKPRLLRPKITTHTEVWGTVHTEVFSLPREPKPLCKPPCGVCRPQNITNCTCVATSPHGGLHGG